MRTAIRQPYQCLNGRKTFIFKLILMDFSDHDDDDEELKKFKLVYYFSTEIQFDRQ